MNSSAPETLNTGVQMTIRSVDGISCVYGGTAVMGWSAFSGRYVCTNAAGEQVDTGFWGLAPNFKLPPHVRKP